MPTTDRGAAVRAWHLPRLVAQAAWVVTHAQRLPEADGPRSGVMGDGEPLRLLIVGDSSAAGVGAATQDQALAGGIVTALATTHQVSWTLIARSGGTARSTLRLLDRVPRDPVDAAVICLGVNDAKNGVRPTAFRQRMLTMIRRLRTEFGARRIVISGLPPLERFPILPPPLGTVVGARTARFDAILRALAAPYPGVVHVPLDPNMDLGGLASDGFHPGPAIYAAWAPMLADPLRVTITDH